MSKRILICKESNGSETRVALIPKDALTLIEKGYEIFIEDKAGLKAGYSNSDYEKVGCNIRRLKDNQLKSFQKLFDGVDIIVRAKRPNREREIVEAKAFSPKTIMIGALDPFEKNSTHIDEYHKAQITAYSIDQLKLSNEDPMNLLASMSKIAGRLAFLDALKKLRRPLKKVLIVGFGVAGKAAFHEALNHLAQLTVIVTNKDQAKEIEKLKKHPLLIDKNASIHQLQKIVQEQSVDADIVITSARKSGNQAPLLIPNETLSKMKEGSVVVDLALSEGGNVEGSEHDKTIELGNKVIVTNTSGYPKALPKEASRYWSQATLLFIEEIEKKNLKILSPC